MNLAREKVIASFLWYHTREQYRIAILNNFIDRGGGWWDTIVVFSNTCIVILSRAISTLRVVYMIGVETGYMETALPGVLVLRDSGRDNPFWHQSIMHLSECSQIRQLSWKSYWLGSNMNWLHYWFNKNWEGKASVAKLSLRSNADIKFLHCGYRSNAELCFENAWRLMDAKKIDVMRAKHPLFSIMEGKHFNYYCSRWEVDRLLIQVL